MDVSTPKTRTGPIMTRMSSVIVLAFAGLVAATLTGCAAAMQNPAAGTPSPSATDFVDGNGMDKEYQATVTSFPLTLPSGIQFPAAPPKALQSGESQTGVGEGVAYAFWLCAWEGEYLKAFKKHDETRASNALTQISKWTHTGYYATYVSDPDGIWVKNNLDPAEKGDASGITQDFTGEGCPSFGLTS